MNHRVPFDRARVLVVCNKLETGYDDPWLQSMYVDRSLRGAHAVQVLSRLNRNAPGKTRVSVVDFANTPSTLHAAFAAFWDGTSIDAADAPRLYHSSRADSLVDQILALLTTKVGDMNNNNDGGGDNNSGGSLGRLLSDMSIDDVAQRIVRGGERNNVFALLEEYSDICNQAQAQKAALPKQYVDVLLRALRQLRGGGGSGGALGGTASDNDLKGMKVVVNEFRTSYSGSIAIAPTNSTTSLPWIRLRTTSSTTSSTTSTTTSSTTPSPTTATTPTASSPTTPHKKTTRKTTLSDAVASVGVAYDVRAVESLRDAVHRNIAANDQVGLMNVLTRLALVRVSVTSLRTTGIGKVIRRLSDRTDVHASVQALSLSIVQKWRAMVQDAKSSKDPKTAKAGKSAKGAAQAAKSATNGHGNEACTQTQHDQQRRDLSRNKLITLVGDGVLGATVERALFQKWGQQDFTQYARVLKMIVANLRLNGDLMRRLQQGVLKPVSLVSMSMNDMATKERKRKRENEREASELGLFSQWKKQILKESKRNILPSEEYGECPRCKHTTCYLRHIPDHTSMAGVASRKPESMAICAECEMQWPIE